jgi:hypothetical protein
MAKVSRGLPQSLQAVGIILPPAGVASTTERTTRGLITGRITVRTLGHVMCRVLQRSSSNTLRGAVGRAAVGSSDKLFCPTQRPDRLCGVPNLRCHEYGDFSPWLRRSGRKAGHSSMPSIEANNPGMYTFAPPYAILCTETTLSLPASVKVLNCSEMLSVAYTVGC